MSEQRKLNRTARIIITVVALLIIAAMAVFIFVGFRIYSGMNNAFEIALKDAGVLAENTKAVDLDFDLNFSGTVYDVEFYSEGRKYEYKIDSHGEIIIGSRQSEHVAGAEQTADSASQLLEPTVSDITDQHAKQIALSQAGALGKDVRDYEWDIDNKNGIKVYDIEFKYGGYEYNYYINAANGSVVRFSKEID